MYTHAPSSPRSSHRTRRTGLTVMVGLLASACGAGGADAPPTATQSSATRPTSPPTTQPSRCPAAEPIPADATTGQEITGDLDGDGSSDAIVVYTATDREAVVRVELATGDITETPLDEVPPGPAGLLGVHDLDRDGDDEVFTRIGQGAARELIGILDLDGCELRAVTLNGVPAVFPITSSAAVATGLSCDDRYVDDLYVAELSSSDGQTYEGRIAAYDLHAGVLTETGGEGAGYSIDDLGSIAGVHCGDLGLGR